VELLLVQILVVVVIIQMRTLKTEVETGSVRTAIGHGLLDPKARRKRRSSVQLRCRKGMRLIFLKLVVDCVATQASSETSARTPEEFSFLLNLPKPWNWIIQRYGLKLGRAGLFWPGGAFATILENPRETLNHTQNRTNNRIRSPRLAASGQLEESR
jgi:hypothetical protein